MLAVRTAVGAEISWIMVLNRFIPSRATLNALDCQREKYEVSPASFNKERWDLL
jgi:hypothetical protein